MRDKLVAKCADLIVFGGEKFQTDSLLKKKSNYKAFDLGAWLKYTVLDKDLFIVEDGDYVYDKDEDRYYSLTVILRDAIDWWAGAHGFVAANDYVSSSDELGLRRYFGGVYYRADKLSVVEGTDGLDVELVKIVKALGFRISVPVNQEVLSENVIKALDILAATIGGTLSWDLSSGYQLLVVGDKAYETYRLFYGAQYLLLKETGLKRISTTDKRVTIYLEEEE